MMSVHREFYNMKLGILLTLDWETETGPDQRPGSLGPRRHHCWFRRFDA